MARSRIQSSVYAFKLTLPISVCDVGSRRAVMKDCVSRHAKPTRRIVAQGVIANNTMNEGTSDGSLGSLGPVF